MQGHVCMKNWTVSTHAKPAVEYDQAWPCLGSATSIAYGHYKIARQTDTPPVPQHRDDAGAKDQDECCAESGCGPGGDLTSKAAPIPCFARGQVPAGSMPRISVIGLGFVGLSLAVVSASRGYDTVGVDIDNDKVRRLANGQPDFFEPDLNTMLQDSIKRGSIHVTTDLDHAVKNTEITFLAVGTPLEHGGIDVDLSHVKKAVERIAQSLRSKTDDFHLLVIKSTVPPLTTQNFILPVFRELIENDRMAVVVNPEFLSEGSAIADTLKPYLIVMGSDSDRGLSVLENYYKNLYGTLPEIMRTNIPTAEIIKYANNAFLATRISFINSIGTICHNIPGADVLVVAHAIGKNPNIGASFLQAGPGFGGSCLPKDLAGLIRLLQKMGKRSDLFQAVNTVNDEQFKSIMEMIKQQGCLAKSCTVAVLGLAFKSGTDDIRGAVSVRVIKKLLECNVRIRVHDPMALKNFERMFGASVSYISTVAECLEGADCCVILTEWDAYKNLRPDDFYRMRTRNIIDARRVLDAEEFRGMGFEAVGFGS